MHGAGPRTPVLPTGFTPRSMRTDPVALQMGNPRLLLYAKRHLVWNGSS